ncbi:MAG TPA: HEAT repeat domain-containing protein, partial [Pyrinomonadaceae bacterium]|nr:HEAT repeat domain-containing protein [Pyrinomonadaceae bacterium]
EISRLKPRITQDVLLSLPDETLPELNTVLLSNFEESRRKQNWHTSVIGELIERYATDEILSRMRAIYETQHAGRWECRTQAAFLGYFLRVAPSLGGEYLKAALAAREADHSRCYRDVLKTVAEMHMSAELEDAATAALDDEDSKIVSQAASVLGQYGSADAEKVLWQRLEGNKDESVEEALRNALSKGQGWLLDPEKLKRLRELCVTEKGRKEVDQLISNWTYDIYVNPDPFDDEKYSIAIAQYQLKSLDSLKQKLLQFPKGTIFKWVKGDAQEFQQIKTYLEEHGMKLEREPEKTPQ